ncbi:MAG TPA: MBL fold metallo-hydrolase [Clostridia bacterium]|nr:MBL fold metallo-hydrolase [Clostridia bacterium]
MEFKRLPLGVYQANCYILFDENTKETAVIDPGGDFPEIKSFIEENELKVNYIIITHGHGDHIGALRELKDYTNAVVCIHSEDNEMLKNSRMNYSAEMGYPRVEMSADKLLSDGDELILGGTKLSIIHTPGHSRGGICIYSEGSLFSGDTLFACSIGRTDLEGGSMDGIIDSIKGKLLTLPEATAVYPGHGPSSTILTEKKRNPFLQ